MPDARPAAFSDREPRPTLVFERVIAHPPERVWSALTSHDELMEWHPTPFDVEPQEGGRVNFSHSAPDAPEMPAGTVLAWTPPRLLAYTWGEDELRWELAAHDDGCLLKLTHSFDDRFKAARDAAGWHICLDALERSLDPQRRAAQAGEPRLPGDWKKLNSEYERRFEIPPQQATPPPQT
jgi:uncharacterized protein YndB with AHSA1/START domain